MKITIKHLGALDQAEFSLGDLTIICGENNTGKTYATYALFGFLSFWREVFSVGLPRETIDELLKEGSVRINLRSFVADAQTIVSRGCDAYAQQLPRVFAAPKDRFEHSSFYVEVIPNDLRVKSSFERRMKAAKGDLFLLTKDADSEDLSVTLLVEKQDFQLPPDAVYRVVSDAIKDIVFGSVFPNPFIASAERTGAAIFRKELNFPRNRMLEEMSQADKKIDPLDLLFKVYEDYALPVKTNVEFTRQLESLVKQTSFVATEHPEVMADFCDIIGGDYMVTREDQLYYVPKGKKVRLSMDESSSAVRSLLDLGFYLRHVAKPGDLLMVDEPELNLHPANQRRVARLFARLTNLGIKVFITTHSDYIIKELNTLIMLGRDIPRMREIAEREKYKPEEMLSADSVRVYIAEEALVDLGDGGRKKRRHTLVPADINQEFGIEARSFDATIDAMNRIQEEIVWGGE